MFNFTHFKILKTFNFYLFILLCIFWLHWVLAAARGGYSPSAVCGLLIVVASPVAEHWV